MTWITWQHEVKFAPGPWRYEPETKTIRSVPANYWLASMDSFEGAVSHEANAALIAASPEMYEALERLLAIIPRSWLHPQGYTQGKRDRAIDAARAALTKARGEV